MYGYESMNPYSGNPYIQGIQNMQSVQGAPRQEVVKVNGENGARAFQMSPNSSALLLDASGLMVWLCVTDGAGYKSVTAYDITPHQEATTPDFGSLESRIKRLEEMMFNGNPSNTPATTGKSTSEQHATDKADV